MVAMTEMTEKGYEESDSAIKEAWEYKSFAKFYLLLQIIFIILFGTLVEYGDTAKGMHGNATYNLGDGQQLSNFQYIKFQVTVLFIAVVFQR